MKKIISFVLVLWILFLVFQFGINLFKTNHSINYSIKKSDKNILIKEEYLKDKKVDYYYFELTIDKVKFVFDVDNKFNKQKKILEDVKFYEDDELMCISPIYMKKNNNPEVICNIDGEQYSYTSIKDEYDLDDFVKSIENFDSKKYKLSNKATSIGRNNVYKEHLYNKENIIIYNYSDLLKITKEDDSNIKFSDYDVYDNELGVLINKYYIIPKYDHKPEYSKILIIDLDKEKIYELKIKEKLSTNIYINGIVKDKLYIFDKSNLVQYEINPKNLNYRIVGNTSSNAQYYNGKWQTRNIYEFSKQEIKFKYNYPIKENYVEAFETDKFYYYYNSKNEFYKVYKKNLNKPIFLFEFEDMDEVTVINNCIYFINNSTLYRYDNTGLKKILINNEFKYNKNNIYGVYYK